jgi:predicted nucleic acid-binding protein
LTCVVDASVAVKWFFTKEPNAAEAFALLQDEPSLIAPDLVIAETCNLAWRWWRLGRLTREEFMEVAATVPRLLVELVGTAALAPRAVAIAAELDHPVYDCLYLALAEARQLRLVTADPRLLNRLRGSPWAEAVVHLADYPAGR